MQISIQHSVNPYLPSDNITGIQIRNGNWMKCSAICIQVRTDIKGARNPLILQQHAIDRTLESAGNILDWLQQHYTVRQNWPMKFDG